jgi:hypothetical protein
MANTYTKPVLRETLKKTIRASDKGGRKGQWSARKSQLLVKEYEKRGGGYTGEKTAAQEHLKKWSAEKWQTKTGRARARHGKVTARYLPAKAWEKLSPAQRRATDKKKRAGSRSGKQFVANTTAAKRVRRSATAASTSTRHAAA